MKNINTNTYKTSALSSLGRSALFVCVSTVLLSACVGNGPRQSVKHLRPVDNNTLSTMADHVVQESEKLAKVQEQLNTELQKVAESQEIPASAPKYDPLEDKVVSIRMYEADVGQLLWAMSDQLGMNLLVDPKVLNSSKRASINLSNVTAREVFNHILHVFDLYGDTQGSTLVVNLMEEKVYDLDFLNTNLNVDITSGGNVFGANQSVGGGGGGSSGGGGGGGANALRSDFSLSGGMGSQSGIYEQLQEALVSILGSNRSEANSPEMDEKEKVPSSVFSLNPTSGTLFVRARPSQMRSIESIVNRYKTVLGRQVQIEAQLIDVELKDGFQFGVDWNLLRNYVAGAIGQSPIQVDAGRGQLESGTDARVPIRTLTYPAQLLGTPAAHSAGLTYAKNSFSVALNTLRNFGSVKVLSNPSIRARNGSPALLSVGTNIRYLSSASVTVTNPGGGASTTSSDAQTDSLFSGIVVGVVPFVRADGKVELLIHPMQTDVDPSSLQLVDAGGGTRVTLPVVSFKGMTTTLSLRDGDTVLIGGLIDQKIGSTNNGIPGLSDMVGIGKLFDKTNDSHASRELVMVIKVTIL